MRVRRRTVLGRNAEEYDPIKIMRGSPSLEELWNSAPPGARIFDHAQTAGLPAPARRYLEHAIAAGAPLASAVRLRMHGEIKLKAWYPFSAEEVIYWEHGMIWQASVRMRGITIRGSDRLVDGRGAMQWKLLGILPFIRAAGPDITRSAAGRVNAESIWLPSALCGEGVSWTAGDTDSVRASLVAHGETAELDCGIGADGRIESFRMPRWGNPGGGEFRLLPFGGVAEGGGTFDGYTIPTRVRVGWYAGTPRFEAEGEFFRATVDEAAFR